MCVFVQGVVTRVSAILTAATGLGDQKLVWLVMFLRILLKSHRGRRGFLPKSQSALAHFKGSSWNSYCVLISSLPVNWASLNAIVPSRSSNSALDKQLKSPSLTAMLLPVAFARAELALYLGCGCPLDIEHTCKFQ